MNFKFTHPSIRFLLLFLSLCVISFIPACGDEDTDQAKRKIDASTFTEMRGMIYGEFVEMLDEADVTGNASDIREILNQVPALKTLEGNEWLYGELHNFIIIMDETDFTLERLDMAQVHFKLNSDPFMMAIVDALKEEFKGDLAIKDNSLSLLTSLRLMVDLIGREIGGDDATGTAEELQRQLRLCETIKRITELAGDMEIDYVDTAHPEGEFLRPLEGYGKILLPFLEIDSEYLLKTIQISGSNLKREDDEAQAFGDLDPLGEDYFGRGNSGDGWIRTWGGDGQVGARGLALDGSRNSYVAGRFKGTIDFNANDDQSERESSDQGDSYLVKYNRDGSFRWVKIWGGDSVDFASDVACDSPGNIYITGSFLGKTDLDPSDETDHHDSNSMLAQYLIKLDPEGDLLWNIVWDDDCPIIDGITISADGEILLVGAFQGKVDFDSGPEVVTRTSIGDSNAFLMQLDRDGNFKWVRSWGSGGSAIALAVGIDSRDDIYIVGGYKGTVDLSPGPGEEIYNSAGDYGSYLLKLAADGSYKWVRTYKGSGVRGIAFNRNGNVYGVGGLIGEVDLDPGNRKACLIEYNPEGRFIRAALWGGPGFNRPWGVVLDRYGNLIIAGSVDGVNDLDPGVDVMEYSAVGTSDSYLLKINPHDIEYLEQVDDYFEGVKTPKYPGQDAPVEERSILERGVAYPDPKAYGDEFFSAKTDPQTGADWEDMIGVINTNKGDIKIKFFHDVAPRHVENFVYLARTGFFDGLAWHRYEPGFVIQGGDPTGTGTGGTGYLIPSEINEKKHTKATVAAARTGDAGNPERKSSGSQFYIMLDTSTFLDGKYTVWGRVIEGMDVVLSLREDDLMESIEIREDR